MSTKSTIAASFSRAAAQYDQAASVQREVADALAKQILDLPLPDHPMRILEIGCGTGFLGATLMPAIPDTSWYFTDIADGMIIRSRAALNPLGSARFLVMDGEAPCFAPATFDLICSSLAVQWFANLRDSFRGLTALLKPGGRLIFSTLAADSFREWQDLAAEHGVASGIPSYPDLAAWQKLLPETGPVLTSERHHRITYKSGHDFLRDLKAIGAGHPRDDHRAVSPGALRRLLRVTEPGFSTTYHVAVISVQRNGP